MASMIVYTNFSKRQNSTKIPDGNSGGRTITYELKEGTSIENPVFIINESMPHDITYVWALWHYYFVTDIVNLDGYRSEIHCRQDVLASNRNAILNYVGYVERADSDYNAMINDSLLTSEQNIVSSDYAETDIGLNLSGVYVIPISSKEGIRLHCFSDLDSASAFYNGVYYIDPSSGLTYTETKIAQWMSSLSFQSLNITDYMGTMMWLPIDYSAYVTYPGVVACGMLEMDVPSSDYPILNARSLSRTITLNLPYNIYGDFRKGNPNFSRYSLQLPGVGTVGLNSIDASKGSISLTYDLDFYTGNVTYVLRGSSGNTIASFSGQLGVQVPSGKININTSNFISSAIGVGLGIASGGAAGIASAVISGVSAVNNVLEPQVSIQGGAGNIGAVQHSSKVRVSLINLGSAEFPDGVAGRPLYEWRRLGDLYGFVQCAGASININALDNDRNEINGLLNSGVYIE